MTGKAHKIAATPVGEIVARGDAEIGFQEVAELLPVKGITFAGRLPQEVELFTRYSAAVAKRSKQPVLAQQLVRYISSIRHPAHAGEDGAAAPAAMNGQSDEEWHS